MGLSGAGTRYYFPQKSGSGVFKTKVKLPDDLSCSNCVLQWWWNVGNNWGCDNTGCGKGKGRQESFVNCADIKINPSSEILTKPPVPKTQKPVTQKPEPATQEPATTVVNPSKRCKAVGMWKTVSGMEQWCNDNCPSRCPPSHCRC